MEHTWEEIEVIRKKLMAETGEWIGYNDPRLPIEHNWAPDPAQPAPVTLTEQATQPETTNAQ